METALAAFTEGLGFEAASLKLQGLSDISRLSQFNKSIVLLGSLAAEIYLKSILLRDGTEKRGHDLRKLFAALPPDWRSCIENKYTPDRITQCRTFEEHLAFACTPPFKAFRYQYEEAQYSYFCANIPATIRTAVLAREPSWAEGILVPRPVEKMMTGIDPKTCRVVTRRHRDDAGVSSLPPQT